MLFLLQSWKVVFRRSVRAAMILALVINAVIFNL